MALDATKCQEPFLLNLKIKDMQFKDIKQNYPVYVLNKQDLTISAGKVTAVSFPHFDMNPKSTKTEMVIDVTIDVNGKTATYTIPENLSVTFAGELVLATDKLSLANEIEALRNQAEQILASVDKQKQILAKSTELLSELNPIYKEKQETEKRFNVVGQVDLLIMVMEPGHLEK